MLEWTGIRSGGKGVIDLLALYLDGTLEETKRWLLGLGLARPGAEFSRPWSESRPMHLGWYQYAEIAPPSVNGPPISFSRNSLRSPIWRLRQLS